MQQPGEDAGQISKRYKNLNQSHVCINSREISPSRLLYRSEKETVVAHVFICPGGRLNKKDGLTMYGDSHVKDKTS